MTEKAILTKGRVSVRLFTEGFYGLVEELARWRTDPDIILMENERDKGKILDFVNGLRLSARIACLIRDIVSTEGLEVSWGHLVDRDGISCSPECDIIIHRLGYIRAWNGHHEPIMDFKFIECEQALGIVSCKSLIRSVDKEYCQTLRNYHVRNIFLVAECCSPSPVERLKNQAQAAGYTGFYYLYTIRRGQSVFKVDENALLDFISRIRTLASSDGKDQSALRA